MDIRNWVTTTKRTKFEYIPENVQAEGNIDEPVTTDIHQQTHPQNVNPQTQVPESFAQNFQFQTHTPVSPSLNIEGDPSKRPPISSYPANERENFRRSYLLRGPTQPIPHKFPDTVISGVARKFNKNWYKKYPSWLEYSLSEDALFCLCCYLFKIDHGNQGGGDAFVGEGFRNWKKMDRLEIHVGDHVSVHRKCEQACRDLLNQPQHIDINLANITERERINYRLRLLASVKCVRFLLKEGLPFRGHDESEGSSKRGLFISQLEFLSENNVEMHKIVLKNAPENHKLIAPSIQKDICRAAAFLTTQAIIKEIKDDFFSLLVDEARDTSIKEQMAVVLRYVDKYGCIIERFLGIIHVPETSALTLKGVIDQLFSKHGLSMSRVRGQGYDGASNMSGKFKGLKSLILSESPCAFYIHCFAHQLQLTLVAVAKKHKSLCSFFDYLGLLANIVGASCKRKEILRLKQFQKVAEGIASGAIKSGRGLNQETTLKRPGETRWSSHFKTILSVITLFSPIMDVLEFIADDDEGEKSTEASTLLKFMHDFEFVLLLHLLKGVMGITNDLSQALQRKDQDIVNAIALVNVTKQRLQCMRENWDDLLAETCGFCALHSIDVPRMEDIFVFQGRPRRNIEEITNLHRFRVQLFFTVIDSQLGELNDRFDNTNTELLSSIACLDPCDSFSTFDKKKLIEFAKLYPSEFDDMELLALDGQLQNYIVDMRNDPNFLSLKGIGELTQMLVKKRKNDVYPQVYLLLKLALILPVATATVERTFSAMNIVKNELRNQMGDEWMNDCLVTYIEHDIFLTIKNEAIMQQFQAMKPRKILL